MHHSIVAPTIFKDCSFTIAIHDFAYPKPYKIGPWGIFGQEKRLPQELQIHDSLSIEVARTMTDEELGKWCKYRIADLDKHKDLIEKQSVTL